MSISNLKFTIIVILMQNFHFTELKIRPLQTSFTVLMNVARIQLFFLRFFPLVLLLIYVNEA